MAWATPFGGTYSDEVNSVALDLRVNDVLLGGFVGNGAPVGDPVRFGHSAEWGAHTLGGADAFVARVNADGGVVWASLFGGSGVDMVLSVGVDSEGNALVAGYFESTAATFGTGAGAIVLYNAASDGGGPSADAFALKLSAAGTLLWAVQLGGAGYDVVWGADVAPLTGELYVGGSFEGDGFVVGPEQLEVPEALRTNKRHGFVVKIAKDGSVAWTLPVAGAGNEDVLRIAVDAADGSVYVSAATDSYSALFGNEDEGLLSDELAQRLQPLPRGTIRAVVAQLAPGGQPMWAAVVGAGLGFALALDPVRGAAGALVLGGALRIKTSPFALPSGTASTLLAGFGTGEDADGFVAKFAGPLPALLPGSATPGAANATANAAAVAAAAAAAASGGGSGGGGSSMAVGAGGAVGGAAVLAAAVFYVAQAAAHVARAGHHRAPCARRQPAAVHATRQLGRSGANAGAIPAREPACHRGALAFARRARPVAHGSAASRRGKCQPGARDIARRGGPIAPCGAASHCGAAAVAAIAAWRAGFASVGCAVAELGPQPNGWPPAVPRLRCIEAAVGARLAGGGAAVAGAAHGSVAACAVAGHATAASFAPALARRPHVGGIIAASVSGIIAASVGGGWLSRAAAPAFVPGPATGGKHLGDPASSAGGAGHMGAQAARAAAAAVPRAAARCVAAAARRARKRCASAAALPRAVAAAAAICAARLAGVLGAARRARLDAQRVRAAAAAVAARAPSAPSAAAAAGDLCASAAAAGAQFAAGRRIALPFALAAAGRAGCSWHERRRWRSGRAAAVGQACAAVRRAPRQDAGGGAPHRGEPR